MSPLALEEMIWTWLVAKSLAALKENVNVTASRIAAVKAMRRRHKTAVNMRTETKRL